MKKPEPQITITVSYSEIKALTTASDAFMEFCRVHEIPVPMEYRAALYSLFFRMMMELKKEEN